MSRVGNGGMDPHNCACMIPNNCPFIRFLGSAEAAGKISAKVEDVGGGLGQVAR